MENNNNYLLLFGLVLSVIIHQTIESSMNTPAPAAAADYRAAFIAARFFHVRSLARAHHPPASALVPAPSQFLTQTLSQATGRGTATMRCPLSSTTSVLS